MRLKPSKDGDELMASMSIQALGRPLKNLRSAGLENTPININLPSYLLPYSKVEATIRIPSVKTESIIFPFVVAIVSESGYNQLVTVRADEF